jgi:thioredoxin-related protein
MKWVAIICMLFSFSVMAQDDHKAERLAQFKQRALENIDKRIAMMEESKSCINSAQSKQELKQCRKDGKAKRKQMREEMKAQRMALKQQRQK